MVFPVLPALAGAARRAVRCRAAGIWLAISAQIEGRNAVSFERERRATLLSVPLALPPGTELYDKRPDGSALLLRVPATARIDSAATGDIPVICPPAKDLPDRRLLTARPDESEPA
jgi:hypothetical protein